jgi:hypothetical protein
MFSALFGVLFMTLVVFIGVALVARITLGP